MVLDAAKFNLFKVNAGGSVNSGRTAYTGGSQVASGEDYSERHGNGKAAGRDSSGVHGSVTGTGKDGAHLIDTYY